MRHHDKRWQLISTAAAGAVATILASSAHAQTNARVLGLDVSAWQSNISQTTWNNISNIENRKFVFIRASRGGTTGEYHAGGGYPAGDTTEIWGSQRYDDPYYIQNMNRATTAGMFVGSYHFSRPDVLATTANSNPPGGTAGVANTGTDEANHFLQMAGPFMRPGYLPPVHDLEAGDGLRTDQEMSQFTIDFSNRIYEVMQIRPAIYLNGNYAHNILGGGTAAQRDAMAKPNPIAPSTHSPGHSALWTARWPNQTDPNSIAVQTAHPKDSFANIYGPWDDYGDLHPWVFWQYASTGRLQSFNNGGSNLDFDVAQGDIEYVKNQLIPAIWWNDSSGDWSTLSNWNSGQPVVAPPSSPGQLTPFATGPLPTPRLPGAAGSGPTAGSNDTVILDRAAANITVTLSTGTHNIRKLYMRETLNISGGSLTINYDPTYRPDNLPNVLHAGPISAQFSGPVTMTGGSLTAHTIQVDPTRVFTVGGTASVTLNTLTLQRGATPAKLLINGDVNIAPLNNATAVINTNAGAASSGLIDLAGATRTLNVANGSAERDLDVLVPITNGSLRKAGLGTMRLNVSNSLTGATTIDDGILEVTAAGQLGSSVVANMTVVTPGSLGAGHGGTLRMSGNMSYNIPLTLNGGGLNGVDPTAPGSVGALDANGGTSTWAGAISLLGTGVNGTDPTINQVSAQAGATLVLSGVLGDSGDTGGLAKSGDGDLVLTGASPNTFGERFRIYGGRVIIEKNGALGDNASDTGATGNTFQLAGSNTTIAFRNNVNYTTNEWINLDGNGSGALGQLDNLAGNNTFAGKIGLSAAVDAKIGISAGSLNLAGGIYSRGTDGSRVINKLGAGKLIISGDSNGAPTNSLNGSLTNSTFNVNAGTVETRAPSATSTNLPGVTTWNVNTGAALQVGGGLFSTQSLNVTGGDVAILPGSDRTIRTSALNVTGGGSVDVGDSKIIVEHNGASPMGSWNGSAYTGLIGLVQQGYTGGAWNGNGIGSSQSAGVLTAVAIAEASDVLGLLPTQSTTWRGQVVDGTTVLMTHTWGGDADMNGTLDGDDYFHIDSNILLSGVAFGYDNGDFNYDGEINGDDYFVIDSNYTFAGGNSAFNESAGFSSGLATVPEPAGLLALIAPLASLRRRRK